MLGAITGDIIGSVYEENNVRRTDFQLFREDSHITDDSVLTIAQADCLLSGAQLKSKLLEYYYLYPDALYGNTFMQWLQSGADGAIASHTNGAAMRVSPVAWAYKDLSTVLLKAEESAVTTHAHPEAVRGAQAVASAVFLARAGDSKQEIKKYIEENFRYYLDFSIEELQANYSYDDSCQGSVPQAIFTFLISSNFEESVRLAVSIGGDSDTIACINGSIAEAFYKGVPVKLLNEVLPRLDDHMLLIASEFTRKFVE